MNDREDAFGLKRAVWRVQAARVVEELFPVTGVGEWDGLLELRKLILIGDDWGGVVDHFLVCRERLERDHYLPFYRLRRLLEGHLRLEMSGGGSVRTGPLALWRHRRMADVRRRALLEHEAGGSWVGARADEAAVSVALVEAAG